MRTTFIECRSFIAPLESVWNMFLVLVVITNKVRTKTILVDDVMTIDSVLRDRACPRFVY